MSKIKAFWFWLLCKPFNTMTRPRKKFFVWMEYVWKEFDNK